MNTALDLWEEAYAKRGYEMPRTCRRQLAALEVNYGIPVLAWAAKLYFEEKPLRLEARDFEEWLDENEPPDEDVCRAYLTGDPMAIKLAGELETLQGSWFPTKKTQEEIEHLRGRLRAACG